MGIQDNFSQCINKLYSKEAVENDMLQSAPPNQPPPSPPISKFDAFEKLQERIKAEILPKDSLESSSDWSVLDPDGNLFDVFSDKETFNAVLTSFFADKQLQKAALLGDILAQWRLSQRMEKTIFFRPCQRNLENPLISVLANESPENLPFIRSKHPTCPSQYLGLTYQPSCKHPSNLCLHSFSFARDSLIPAHSNQQKTHSEDKPKSISPRFNPTSQLMAVRTGFIQNDILRCSGRTLGHSSRRFPRKISLRDAGIQCRPLVENKLSGQIIQPSSCSVGVQSNFSSPLTSCGSQTSPLSKHRLHRCIAVQCNTLLPTSLPASSRPSLKIDKTQDFPRTDCLSVAGSPGNVEAEAGGKRRPMTWPTPRSTPCSSFTLVSSLPPSPEYSIRNQSHSHSLVYEERLHRDATLADLIAARSTCARKLELVEMMLQQKCVSSPFQKPSHP
ncbi:hypothetical protein TcWFU_000135 [Taenia crassiceps]|uniref:Uncharacterized protein n=1 Tax=Taenia crassiceps TaxID=6207 RepID=A0ABR4QJ89_9CEST